MSRRALNSILALALLASAVPVQAAKYEVDSLAALQARIAAAGPGDVIIVKLLHVAARQRPGRRPDDVRRQRDSGGGEAATITGPYPGAVWHDTVLWQTAGPGAMPAGSFTEAMPVLDTRVKPLTPEALLRMIRIR